MVNWASVTQGDCLEVLSEFPSGAVDLVYIDPPFNTGGTMSRSSDVYISSDNGDRTGYGGRRYSVTRGPTISYDDDYGDDYLGFLGPRLIEMLRVLRPSGSLMVHLDQREVHYVKVYLDGLLGRDHFVNEIIWHWDYGARSKRRWSVKHNTILWYVKNPLDYTYNYDTIDRIPYLAPMLVGPEKAAKGKTPTDVWWHTIVSPTGKEKTGYPTQKPLGVLERIVRTHSNPGEVVLDCFAGSGTTGAAALKFGRKAVLVDNNPQAVSIMTERMRKYVDNVTDSPLWIQRDE